MKDARESVQCVRSAMKKSGCSTVAEFFEMASRAKTPPKGFTVKAEERNFLNLENGISIPGQHEVPKFIMAFAMEVVASPSLAIKWSSAHIPQTVQRDTKVRRCSSGAVYG